MADKNFLRNLRKGVDNVGTMCYNIITGQGKPTIKKDEVMKNEVFRNRVQKLSGVKRLE